MDLHQTLLSIGAAFLLGLLADAAGKRTKVPRVTLLILLGVALGSPGLDVFPEAIDAWHEFLSTAALTMVAFGLGGRLTLASLRSHGREILGISIAVVVLTAMLVAGGLALVGFPLVVALVLGGIATATDPAATRDVVGQTGARGPFPDRLLGIVAIDDAWGVIAFGVVLVLAKSLAGHGGADVILMVARDLGGALLIGVVTGLPAAYLTGRLKPGEPILLEVLGLVFLCAGLAVWLDVSFLLAGMIAGTLVANLARHKNKPFDEIRKIEGPFLVLFFLLAGATLDLPLLQDVIGLCAAYAVLRVIGRMLGGLLGARAVSLPATEGLWTGAALTPQAGVALGMALVASHHLPVHGETILAVTVATTVAFEIAGPLLTQIALRRHRAAGQRGTRPG